MTNGKRALDDLDDEIRHHLEHEIQDNMARGMSLEAARQEARRKFGNLTMIKEQTREVWVPVWLDHLRQDVEYGLRSYRRNPGVIAAVIISLALGIGAATGLFTIVYDVVLNPFPAVDGDRLVTFGVVVRATCRNLVVTGRQLLELQADVLEGVTAFDASIMIRTGTDVPESVSAQFFSTNGLSAVYRLSPLLGRLFNEGDGRLGEEPRRVVVLTYRYWQTRFGGQTDAIGQRIVLNHEPYELVGVLPQTAFREGQGDGTDVVVPLHIRLDPGSFYNIRARLKPGMDLRTAEAGLQPVFQRFARETPQLYPNDFRVSLRSFISSRRTVGYVPTILVIFAASVLLLV